MSNPDLSSITRQFVATEEVVATQDDSYVYPNTVYVTVPNDAASVKMEGGPHNGVDVQTLLQNAISLMNHLEDTWETL